MGTTYLMALRSMYCSVYAPIISGRRTLRVVSTLHDSCACRSETCSQPRFGQRLVTNLVELAQDALVLLWRNCERRKLAAIFKLLFEELGAPDRAPRLGVRGV